MAASQRSTVPSRNAQKDRRAQSPQDAVNQAVDQERRRLAQTLHDTICQSLTALYFTAKTIEKKMERRGSEGAGEIGELGEMIHKVVGELQGLARELAPRAEDSEGR